MNIQQLSLSSASLPEIAKNTFWFFGLMLYLIAQLLCVYALNYAPLTLCAALFTTMLIFDALIARFLLKKHISRTDQLGLAIILGSIIVTAVYGPQEEYNVTADCMWEWLGLWTGYTTVVFLGLVLLFTYKTYKWFDKKYPHFRSDTQDKVSTKGPSRRLQLIMMVIYPANLAVFETFGQLSLKGVAGMADMHFLQGQQQTNKIMFWAVVLLWLVCVINTVMWLRTVYAKFTTIECLPVEYGLVGVFSIFGSLLFYQEYLDKKANVFIVACSCGGILLGIAIMVSGKHKTLEQTRARRIERLHASMVRGAPIKTERPKTLPWDGRGTERWKAATAKVMAATNQNKGIQHRHSMVDIRGGLYRSGTQGGSHLAASALSPSKTGSGTADGFIGVGIASPRLSMQSRQSQRLAPAAVVGADGGTMGGAMGGAVGGMGGAFVAKVGAAAAMTELLRRQREALVGGQHWSNSDSGSGGDSGGGGGGGGGGGSGGDGRQRLSPVRVALHSVAEEGSRDVDPSRRLFQRQGGNAVAPAPPHNPTIS
jgi:uncharacterized membrane protein YgcG